ncbi:GNAT family N-acetyltransferase [Actinokineospora bangkokensis]|uniref:GNAT family N-acetyltransferase n=1 Tax=Actinokineospora bangkokensis TaxID=1193682 RepID=UPI000A06BA70|nr:GNAT family N-acetyltransferase [Actinokineospora bangkokensis]
MSAPLLAAQSARFAELDPLLPAAVAPPEGEGLVVALPGGDRVAGVVTRTEHPRGAAPTLWAASEVWELHPLLGGAPGSAMDVLLRRWAGAMARVAVEQDSSCLVTWPSRDVAASAALLAHGFAPLSVLAVRVPAARGPSRRHPVSVRRAGFEDLEFLTRSAMAELEYSAQVGSAVVRPAAPRIKWASLSVHLAQGDPVWIAERGGEPVGHLEGWQTVSAPASWAETRVPHGRWGYVNCLSVLPGSRGSGVGGALVDTAHDELLNGAVGSFLYFNPPNPLSPVFWARRGYRPLWTLWELRPASALR